MKEELFLSIACLDRSQKLLLQDRPITEARIIKIKMN